MAIERPDGIENAFLVWNIQLVWIPSLEYSEFNSHSSKISPAPVHTTRRMPPYPFSIPLDTSIHQGKRVLDLRDLFDSVCQKRYCNVGFYLLGEQTAG